MPRSCHYVVHGETNDAVFCAEPHELLVAQGVAEVLGPTYRVCAAGAVAWANWDDQLARAAGKIGLVHLELASATTDLDPETVNETVERYHPEYRDLLKAARIGDLLRQDGPPRGIGRAADSKSARARAGAERDDRREPSTASAEVSTGGDQQIAARIERPDFRLTTDVRVTSDPLWNLLARFRRLLVDGERGEGTTWPSLLAEIRARAWQDGLRARAPETEHLIASVTEMHESDPDGHWLSYAKGGDPVVLVFCGDESALWTFDSSIPLHSSAERHIAADWAEGWMRAREQQLASREVRHEVQQASADAAQTTPGEAPLKAETTSKGLVLDGGHLGVLRFLAKSPMRRFYVTEVDPDSGPADRKTVSKRLRELADSVPPLVDYPRNSRRGVAITPAGLEALKSIPPADR